MFAWLRRPKTTRRACLVWFAASVGFGMPQVGWADSFDDYILVERFELPVGAGPVGAFPEGRLLTVIGAEVYVESAVGSRVFESRGVLPDADMSSFGAAFVRVSPDGTWIAVGNNGGAAFDRYQVGVFQFPGLTGVWFDAGHFDATWVDNRYLAITAGDFGSPSVVTLLDSAPPESAKVDNRVVIENIGGASGGVTVDAAGNLYTGNGFETGGPSGTGAVKGFFFADWMAAWQNREPLDFEADGRLIIDVLSASPLGFDVDGNLFIGGGDFSSETEMDFVGVVREPAVSAALSGGGPADGNDPNVVRRLDPDPGNDANFFTVSYGAARRELYLSDFGDTTVHVYRDTMGVPAISDWGVIILALVTLAGGSAVLVGRNFSTLSKGAIG